jgi:hypothetical protein
MRFRLVGHGTTALPTAVFLSHGAAAEGSSQRASKTAYNTHAAKAEAEAQAQQRRGCRRGEGGRHVRRPGAGVAGAEVWQGSMFQP